MDGDAAMDMKTKNQLAKAAMDDATAVDGGGTSAVPTGANGNTQGILQQRVRPTGDGDGRRRRGGVIPLLSLCPSLFPYIAECLSPDLC